jgi:hypothetical protein
MVPLRIMLAYEHSVLNETFKAGHPIYLRWLMCDMVYQTSMISKVLPRRPADEHLGVIWPNLRFRFSSHPEAFDQIQSLGPKLQLPLSSNPEALEQIRRLLPKLLFPFSSHPGALETEFGGLGHTNRLYLIL